MTAATPMKLKSGAWGARASSEAVRAGDVLCITTKAGKSWDAMISRVIWAGNGVAICATERKASNPCAPQKNSSHYTAEQAGCSRCCETATRRAQIWEDCEYCGTEPVYR